MKSAWALPIMLTAQCSCLSVSATEAEVQEKLPVLTCKCVHTTVGNDRSCVKFADVSVDLNERRANADKFEASSNEYRWLEKTDAEETKTTGLKSHSSGLLNRTSLVYEVTFRFEEHGELTVNAVTVYQCEIAKPRV